MSRCFPFPPPGYEKKPGPEDAYILKEEKQKDKKPKKEKKEKEKREGKEKRDKDRSDEKQREKRDRKEKHKDKKEKHREKKKEKDNSKEKEKSSTCEARKVTGLPEARSGEKFNPKDGKDNSYFSDEKNCGAKFHGQKEKPVQSNFLDRRTEESKFVQELGRRITDEKAAVDQSVDRFSAAEKKRDDETQRSAVRNPGDLAEDKGKSKDRRFDNKMDMQGIREEARFSGNSMVQSVAGTAKVEVVPRVVEKINERKMERKEKTKEKDDKWGEKHKNKDGDKKTHGKDKDGEKERKKEKAKGKSEYKKSELDKSKDVNRSLVSVIDEKTSTLPSNYYSNANDEGNFKKRKDRHTNGFLYDNEIRPNKLPRHNCHPVMENGRKLEACQTPSLSCTEKQGVANLKVDNKERKNGIIELQSLPTSKPEPEPEPKPKPPPVTADTDQIVEASRKPPHPDSKYLNQVLLVPKMDEYPEYDDQEWLFGSQDPPSRKPEVRSPCVGEERQVWCEPLHIEQADLVALPYVLPY